MYQARPLTTEPSTLIQQVHGHYADAGEVAALVASTMASTEACDMVMTGHSLGRNKLEHLLSSGGWYCRSPFVLGPKLCASRLTLTSLCWAALAKLLAGTAWQSRDLLAQGAHARRALACIVIDDRKSSMSQTSGPCKRHAISDSHYTASSA